MVNKKGYIRTLEAIVAVVLFLVFLTATIVINQPQRRESVPQDIKLLQDTILKKVQTEQELRTCLVNNDTQCINNTIKSYIPYSIGYDFEICNDPDVSSCIIQKTFPEDITIYSDSLIIQEENPGILRLFLWRKSEE